MRDYYKYNPWQEKLDRVIERHKKNNNENSEKKSEKKSELPDMPEKNNGEKK